MKTITLNGNLVRWAFNRLCERTDGYGTSQDLARQLGVTAHYISHIRQGRVPMSARMVLKIAELEGSK